MRVFETHFKLEFASYRELWGACDEAMVIASQTLGYLQMTPTSPESWEEEKGEAIKRYDRCREVYANVRRKRPFIAAEIAETSEKLTLGCLKVSDSYKSVFVAYKECNEKGAFFDRKPFIEETDQNLNELDELYKRTAVLISKRIDKLYVADFSLGV
jgi:hypothetical protein